jgi:hypothetical protein
MAANAPAGISGPARGLSTGHCQAGVPGCPAGLVVEDRGRQPISRDDVEEVIDQAGDGQVAPHSFAPEVDERIAREIDLDRGH